jgi:hypothetical protein
MSRGKLENRVSLRVTLKTNDEMEEWVQQFVPDIQQSAWEAAPLVTKNVRGNNYQKGVREIIAERRKIRKKVASNSIPQN